MRGDAKGKCSVSALSSTLKHIILSNYGLGCVTRSAAFWVMLVSCKFSLQVTAVCGQRWNFVLSLSFWSGPELALTQTPLLACLLFLLLLLLLLSLPLIRPPPLCLKPHIHSLSVSGEIPVDQRKWSHFLVVPRRTLHCTHTHTQSTLRTSSPPPTRFHQTVCSQPLLFSLYTLNTCIKCWYLSRGISNDMLAPQVFVRACVLQLLKIRDSRLEVEFFLLWENITAQTWDILPVCVLFSSLTVLLLVAISVTVKSPYS